jgi:hypothetical protein
MKTPGKENDRRKDENAFVLEIILARFTSECIRGKPDVEHLTSMKN